MEQSKMVDVAGVPMSVTQRDDKTVVIAGERGSDPAIAKVVEDVKIDLERRMREFEDNYPKRDVLYTIGSSSIPGQNLVMVGSKELTSRDLEAIAVGSLLEVAKKNRPNAEVQAEMIYQIANQQRITAA